MIFNYFKITLRNIWRNKVYALINIAGLTVGMSCALLILMWVQYEMSFDRFHANADRVYRVTTRLDIGDIQGDWALTPYPLGPTFERDYPGVIRAVRFEYESDRALVEYEDKKFFETYLIADPTFFEVFSFPFLRGNPQTALTAIDSIVISERLAEKYFGTENPIGKILKVENHYDCRVTGVIQNVPPNSHLAFDILFSFEYIQSQAWYPKKMQDWGGGYNVYTYLLLQKGFDVERLENKIPDLVHKHLGEFFEVTGGKIEFFLQPLTRIHLQSQLKYDLHGSRNIADIYTLLAIALFVIAIACINSMNLATARSASRAKEIGIRKAVGASKGQLILQFIGEAVLFTLIALIFSFAMVEIALPFFRYISGSSVSCRYLSLPLSSAIACGMVLLVGLLAGFYPALFLSALPSAKALKGGIYNGSSKSLSRNILVVLQFTLSIALMIATTINFHQLNYMKHKDLGFDNEQIISIRVVDDTLKRSPEKLKTTLKGHAGIANVATSSHIPSMAPGINGVVPEGFSSKQFQAMGVIGVDHDFIGTVGIELVAGRNFSKQIKSDQSEAILINETAARQFGWTHPVGKTISRFDRDKKFKKHVIGVVRDFHMQSLHSRIDPLYIYYRPSNSEYIIIKLKPENVSATIRFIKKTWKSFDPAHPFTYQFLDETFNRQYKAEERLGVIFSIFTFLAVFLACLGLFGLTLFTAQKRTKEIGIRKALGAAIVGIILMLAKDFSKWVLIANVIAWPIAYLAMKQWLQNFAYRIDIGIGTFILAALLALVIALLTVGYQAVKAALANPAEALRYE